MSAEHSAPVRLAARITEHRLFVPFVTAVILVNAAVIGMGTYETLRVRYGTLLEIVNELCLAIFVVEALLKIAACGRSPQRYFRDGWNLFDFSVVVASLVPAAGPLATVARMARLLRVLRLVSTLPELRLIVSTLMRSLPGMGHVVLLMSILFYVFAVAGFHLFSEHDPTHWRSLGISLLTLFRIVTLEDWTDVMYTAMEARPWAWVYFVSFVVMGTFVIVNLFIAVVLNNLDEAKTQLLREMTTPPGREEILAELRATQASLARLHERLERIDDAPRRD
jgi:voltage-gated sodium channel